MRDIDVGDLSRAMDIIEILRESNGRVNISDSKMVQFNSREITEDEAKEEGNSGYDIIINIVFKAGERFLDTFRMKLGLSKVAVSHSTRIPKSGSNSIKIKNDFLIHNVAELNKKSVAAVVQNNEAKKVLQYTGFFSQKVSDFQVFSYDSFLKTIQGTESTNKPVEKTKS